MSNDKSSPIEVTPLHDINKAYSGLRNSIDHLDEVLIKTAGENKDLGNSSFFSEAFCKLAENDSVRAAKLVFDLHQKANSAKQEMVSIVREIETKTKFLEDQKNRDAKWEERNQYRIWAHKTIRWVAGALLIVLLYSCFVWLQTKCDFIKIPVRDWIVNSQPKA